MMENGYSFWKHNLVTLDWLRSDPGSGIRGIHLEWKKGESVKGYSDLGSVAGLHPVWGRADCIRPEAERTASGPRQSGLHPARGRPDCIRSEAVRTASGTMQTGLQSGPRQSGLHQVRGRPDRFEPTIPGWNVIGQEIGPLHQTRHT